MFPQIYLTPNILLEVGDTEACLACTRSWQSIELLLRRKLWVEQTESKLHTQLVHVEM